MNNKGHLIVKFMIYLLLLDNFVAGNISRAGDQYRHGVNLFTEEEIRVLEKKAAAGDIEAIRCLFEQYSDDEMRKHGHWCPWVSSSEMHSSNIFSTCLKAGVRIQMSAEKDSMR
ncbi:MAG TPA: hypothetical protein VF790_14095 [Dissulfurispiraceae bacterium]